MTTYYTEEHEWLVVEGTTATVGITAHAAEQLGDIVFIDLQDPDTEFEAGDEIGVVESVKAASDIFAPVKGKIVEANEALADNPALANEAPEGDGWFYKIEIADASELEGLMDKAAYDTLIA